METNKVIHDEEVVLMPAPAPEKDFEKEAEKPKKKANTPKKRARDVNELIEAAVKNMTDKEKENLINYLKDEGFAKDEKINALKRNCEQAYEKLRKCEEDYQAMERYYKERLGFIDQQVSAFGNAVRLSIVGGLN